MIPFDAVVLAGGASRRMGTDKAFLTHPGTGEPLWKHQLNLLRSLNPRALWLSANSRQHFEALPGDVAIIHDDVSGAGPISGLAKALAMVDRSIVVLAVDLPSISRLALAGLLNQASPNQGAVYQVNGYFEPLAAVYPKGAATSAQAFLQSGGRRLQDWLTECVTSDLMKTVDCPDAWRTAFQNVNTPDDFAKLSEPFK